MKVPVTLFSFLSVSLLLPTVRAQEVPPPEDYQTPESYVDRVRKEGPVLELTLNDAIRLALANNLQLEIENYNEDLNRQRVLGTKGYYDPTFTFTLGWNSFERPNTSVLDAGVRIQTSVFKSWTGNARLTQNVAGGGQLELLFNNNRNTTNSAYSYVNPQYGSTLNFTFTQPLLKGFRETPTERQLKLYNLDTEISDSQFKQRVSEVIQQVQDQYWELAFTIENHEARRRSLDLAIVQYQNNRKRVEIGVMAPIEITSSRAEVATREQEMIQSEVQIINAQNALKRLLAPDPQASIWNVTLIPTDTPRMPDIGISMEEAIKTALEKRPELEQINFSFRKNEVDRSFYKKDGKPAVDLILALNSYGTAGMVYGSQAIDSDGDGVPDTIISGVPQPNHPFWGNWGDSWGQVFGFDYLGYTAAVRVEIPIRNRANEAQMAQLAITERQLRSQLKDTQQEIIVDVRNAYESIITRRKQLDAARVARELSQEQLDGENKRFEAGLSTNFEVLRYQRDLTDAQVRELRALVDYQIALTALQKATFTIVSDNDIVLAKNDSATN